MKKYSFRAAITALIVIPAVLVSSGCSSSTGWGDAEVSRTRIYGSLDELATDTPQILVGRVISSNVGFDKGISMETTYVTLELYKTSHPSTESARTVVVRETGTPEVMTGLKFMQVGRVYVVFANGNDAITDPEFKYDIRGVDAGIYEADSGISTSEQALAADTAFSRLDANSGDTLPITIHLADLPGF